MIDRLAFFIASAGFVGRVPIAPGTAGSAAGLAIYALIRLLDQPGLEAAVIVITLVVGIWSATVTERVLGTKDPGPVVIDEVLGMLMTVAFLKVTMTGATLGFLLFRVFDVVKPYPARHLENLPGGFGIMLDDAMAGVYSYLAMRLFIWVLPGWFA